ncbi:MAG: DinB family protein [Chloroflexota bacterium]
MTVDSIRPFYADWPLYHRHIVDLVAGMTAEQLAIRPGPERWPIWATVGHMAGVRVFWLCYVGGEPGIADTPWADPSQAGWEDDLDRPRSADELVHALTSTWAIVDRCLDRWTPDMLQTTMTPDGERFHTRQSVLLRLLSHDAYHAGEISQTLGIAGLPQIDLWPPEDHPRR